MLMSALSTVAVVGVLFVVFLRWNREDPAVRTLKLRLAEGAISREEFDEQVNVIRGVR